MALQYGVLRGRVDIFKREDDNNSPHLQIKVLDGNGQAWRAAVNVLSGDQPLVIFTSRRPTPDTPDPGWVAPGCAWFHSAAACGALGILGAGFLPGTIVRLAGRHSDPAGRPGCGR